MGDQFIGYDATISVNGVAVKVREFRTLHLPPLVGGANPIPPNDPGEMASALPQPGAILGVPE